MPEPQTYKNHTRWDPVWHFFITPLLLINIIFAVWAMIRHWPDHPHLFPWAILMSIVIFMAVGKARSHSLKAQDRIIRLEEKLRDRKSTRLNSSHLGISYAVFCLK